MEHEFTRIFACPGICEHMHLVPASGEFRDDGLQVALCAAPRDKSLAHYADLHASIVQNFQLQCKP